MVQWVTYNEYNEETNEPINQFQEKWFVFSNFYPAVVSYDGEEYPTVEHAYQAAKTLDPDERLKIREAKTPAAAKHLGQEVTMRTNWSKKKLRIMEKLLRQKFKPKTPCMNILSQTGDREIIEGNTWHDTYWGVCDGKGKNHLGKLLMKIRLENQPKWYGFLEK